MDKPSTRTRGLGAGKRPLSAYAAASSSADIPRVQDISPSLSAKSQRAMQLLVRHMYRNEAWIRNLIRVMCDIDVGAGPVPISRFPELNELFAAASPFFDSRGIRNFGAWLRDDVYRNLIIDGEAWIRIRGREGYPIESELVLPVQFQALTSEYVPHTFTQHHNGLKFVTGVATSYDRPTHYACYTSHPGEPDSDRRVFVVNVGEMLHVFDPMTGGLRGEVPLASAILRAIKATTIENAELSRKEAAALITAFIPKKAGDDDEGSQLEPDEVSAMIDAIELTPGGIFELPPGYEISSHEPKDEPANFERALRWQLLAICAAAGMPSHYVTQDWSAVTERMVRFVDQGIERRASIVRDQLERQACNPIWKTFVDYAMATGMWTPPVGMKSWELYAVRWKWPKIPNAAFVIELSALLDAEERGAIDAEYIADTMFDRKLEDVQRSAAKGASRAKALGIKRKQEIWDPTTEVAQRIAAETLAEEMLERDLIDESSLDDSIMDDDRV